MTERESNSNWRVEKKIQIIFCKIFGEIIVNSILNKLLASEEQIVEKSSLLYHYYHFS